LSRAIDIALVSLGTTPGLRRSDEQFASLVRAAGASCEIVPVRVGLSGKLRRNAPTTDLVEALAARRSARGVDARAVVFSTITAALLQRPAVPFGIRFDAVAALNRPGIGGAWQRVRERPVLERADVLMPVSRGAAEAVECEGAGGRCVRVPIPVEEIEPAAERDLDAVTYAGAQRKRGLHIVCAAWAEAAPDGARLVIAGGTRERGLRLLHEAGVPEPPGVEWAGELEREGFVDLVRRARVFLNGSTWEDFGIAAMEALAAGTPVVTVPTPGSFEALPLARELAPDLVAGELSAPALAGSLRAGLALDDPARDAYRERALELLRPYRADVLRRVVAERVLPALGVG
jgi:glycosyltransferase involved in cell wall biosynthesis